MFPIDEEYGMLSFFNISTPLWSEVTIVLLLSNIMTISYNERLFLIGLLLGLNNSFLFCLFLLFVYTVIPIVPIVLYFILQ